MKDFQQNGIIMERWGLECSVAVGLGSLHVQSQKFAIIVQALCSKW